MLELSEQSFYSFRQNNPPLSSLPIKTKLLTFIFTFTISKHKIKRAEIMELDSLYDSFEKLTIDDTKSPETAPKSKLYNTEARLWNIFSEILKKHDLEDVSILFQPARHNELTPEKYGVLDFKLIPKDT